MPFLELTLTCREAEQARYEHALEDVGALAVTLSDARADTPDESAVLEPGVGETPLWPELTLSALFDAGTDRCALLHALESFDAGLDFGGARFREVEDADWTRVWMADYHPMQFGQRLWIYPWNVAPPEDRGVVVRLDPGLAFGSGTHATTALCLEWLDALAGADRLHGRLVLDYGCGSGVLAIAALKLGAAQAVGVDNDPQALLATRDNAERNAVDARLQVFAAGHLPRRQFDVVVANILAGALEELASTLARHCAPGAALAVSGILAGQQQALLERYAAWFEHLECAQREGWIRISGRRRG